MFTLIKNGEIYAPNYRGKQDILICMGKIVSVNPDPGFVLEKFPNTVQVVEADQMIIVPGFIDQHMHFLGGGGKLGYSSRAGNISYNDIVKFGVTTAIGSLGVDSYLKNLDELLTRARELESQGLSTYILTGGFLLPLKSITGSVFNDLIYIDKVVGVGEIGISDAYGSQPVTEEIIRISANTKVASAISEKAGVIFIHIGPGQKGLNLIREIINETDLSIKQFVVTHVNRSMKLLEEAAEFAKLGGRIDITTGISPKLGIKKAIAPSKAIKYLIENGVSIDSITLTSDAGGFRVVDDNNQGIDSVLLSSETLLETIVECVKDQKIDLSLVLKTITSNVASIWNFKHKGIIKAYVDADLVFLDNNLNIKRVMFKGKIVFTSD